MSRLFIGNVDNEHMMGDRSRLDYEARCHDAVVASWLVWFARSEDVLCLPYPLSTVFLDYVSELLDLESSPSVVVPDGIADGPVILTERELSDATLLARLTAIIGDGRGWWLEAFYPDRSAIRLAERLGLSVSGSAFFREGGAQILNSKAAFRRIAAGTGIPLPPGRVCSSTDTLAAALAEYADYTGTVIIKRDFDSGGDGNALVVVGRPAPEPIGVKWVYHCPDANGLAGVAALLWPKLASDLDKELVVEAYFPDAPSYYIEFLLDAGAGRPALLNFGESRMEPNWCGFEIPPRTLSQYQIGQLTIGSSYLAEAAWSLGYRGRICVDAITTPEGGVLFNEINGRYNGASHVDQIVRRFFGDDYEHRICQLTKNDVPAGPLNRVLAGLRAESLLWQPGQHEGCVVLADGTDLSGALDYMVLARTADRARDIEAACAATFVKTAADRDLPR